MKREILNLNYVCTQTAGSPVLNNLSFRMFSGEAFGILGMAGIKQKSLCDTLLGNIPFCNGKILSPDQEVYHRQVPLPQTSGIHCINSSSPLVPDLTVHDNLYLTSNHLIYHASKSKHDADALLAAYGLDIPVTMSAFRLNRLDQLKIAILCALNSKRKLVIIPNILDACSTDDAREIGVLLHRLKAEGMSFLIFSDRVETVKYFCDRILFYHNNSSKLFYPDELESDIITDIAFNTAFSQSANWNHRIRKEIPVSIDSLLPEENQIPFQGYSGEIVGIFDSKSYLCNYFSLLIKQKRLPATITGNFGGKAFSFDTLDRAYQQKIAFLFAPSSEDMIFFDTSLADNLCALVFDRLLASPFHFLISGKKQNVILKDAESMLGLPKYDPEDWPDYLPSGKFLSIVLQRYLIFRPKIFVCINPFSRLNAHDQQSLYHFFIKLSNLGSIVLLIGNDHSVMCPVCDRFLFIENKESIHPITIPNNL